MSFNPGTALGTEWLNHFFVVEFNGNPAVSGIHAFKLTPEGAGFQFAGDKKILSGVLATGMDIGADGALYFTDWIDGWERKGYGRIWKLDVRNSTLEKERQETRTLLSADFKAKDEQTLLGFLNHPDMRVRQKAQFVLVEKEAVSGLQSALKQSISQLPRVHGLWGLTQLVLRGKADGSVLLSYLNDEDPEIRAQVCKMIGDVRWEKAGDRLIPLLQDTQARVRFFAAEALGRIAYEPAVSGLIEMLKTNDDRDVYLRHAGTLALARIGKMEPVIALSDRSERALRITAVVTLRHLRHPALARFLEDEDEFIVTEAARAINDDLSVEVALPQLGGMLNRSEFSNEALIRRMINASLRVGTTQAMQDLIEFSMDTENEVEMRVETLMALGTWIKPSVVDRVDGRYRGVIQRDPAEVRIKVAASIPDLLKDPMEEIRVQVLRTLSKLGVQESTGQVELVLTQDKSASVRAEALKALVVLDEEKAKLAIPKVLTKEVESVRIAALQQLENVRIDPGEISRSLENILVQGSSEEQQAAIGALINLPKESAVDQLSLMLDRLIQGDVDGPLQLDLLEVASANGNSMLEEKIKAFRTKHAEMGEVANYLECLEGGNARAGRRVMAGNSAAQCLKCHKVRGSGGVAGPPLDDIGVRRDRLFILQSLIEPSAHLTPGYGVVTVILNNDQVVSGILQSEDGDQLVIKDSQEQDVIVLKTNVRERINAQSSMPVMGDILSKKEIRDLIAFLSSLKEGVM
jgi:putative heme-binding domain-containing protein